MSQTFLFKLHLLFKGIRFYKTEVTPKNDEFRTATFHTVGKHRVEFLFYREVCEDLIFRGGKIKKETFIGYVIRARFDENLPEILYQYNNLKFFFNSRYLKITDENRICDALLNIYLDFLRNEIKEELQEEKK